MKEEINKDATYTFNVQVNDCNIYPEYEDVVLSGQEVNSILMAYIHTNVKRHCNYIAFNNGGILNGETFLKFIRKDV